MLVSTVEVASDVLNGDSVGIIDGDLFGPGKDEILGNLDSQLL